jgi:hypothetical protein
MKIFTVAAIFTLCAGLAHAQDAKTDKYGVVEKPVLADTTEKFSEQTQQIHQDMELGGRYEFTSPADRQKVDRLLGQMATLLESAGSVDTMNHDMRIVLFNDQEEVNGILKHNDSNRLVCESRAPIGSNILRTTCRTHGQIETAARNTKAGLMEFDHARLCNSGSLEHPCEAQFRSSMNGASNRVK